jgi:DNA-binding GntR family transcriptional regulator
MVAPKYEIIANRLRANIGAGLYPAGQLPSTRDLCNEFKASYGSVRTAVLILKTEGLVQGRQGIGVFVKNG